MDKNGNTLENTYDYQNRLTATAAVPKGQGKKEGKETAHTFRYNAYGEVSAQDDTVFAYGDVSGQVPEETAELTKNKKIKKYEYDSAGNRTTFSVGAGGETKLIQTLTRGYKVSFTYDAAGLRTSKTVNGEKTVYVWDGDQLVLELSGSGKIQNRYIRGVDLVYADRGEDTGKQYYVTDPHGNVVQLIDGSGEVIRTYEYDSFGSEVDPDSRDENPFRYCGEYFDRETGEVYLRARYYRPETGRFLTRDTYTGEAEEPLSLHLYTYCENDGVNGGTRVGMVGLKITQNINCYW